MEERLQRIRLLFDEQHIDAYVFKSRCSLEDMEAALHAVQNDERYISPQVSAALGSQKSLDIEEYDILLLEKIAISSSPLFNCCSRWSCLKDRSAISKSKG